MQTLKKGADGWRGIIGEQFTIPSAVRLSLGIAQFFRNKQEEGPLLLTHDGRLQSKEGAKIIAQSLVDSGTDVVFGGMQSTPATSSMLVDGKFVGAILVTASHNPFYWNGIKIKIAPGMPPSLKDEEAIDTILKNNAYCPSEEKGTLILLERHEVFESYAQRAVSALSEEEVEVIRKRKFKIIVDALHGMSADSFNAFFENLGCELTILGGDPDPLFNGILPDPMNPISRRRMVKRMQEEHFDLGFVSDGDGDRLCVLDEKGAFIWPHDILALIFEEIVQHDTSNAGMAVTGPTGSITERVCKKFKRTYAKTPVGFKHASPHLQNRCAILAGGAVGEIGYASDNVDRDPLKSALFLLHCCIKSKMSLSQMIVDLHDRYGHSVYKQWTLSNMSKSDQELKEFGIRMVEHLGYQVKEILSLDGQKIIIDKIAWILVRRATTEGGIRIYAELHDSKELDNLFDFIRSETNTTPIEKA